MDNVAPTPTIDSISALRIEGTSIDFVGLATDPAGTNDTLTYAWDFGDTSTASGANASHTYADNGTYTVELTVTDEDGGSATVSQNITVDNVDPSMSLSGPNDGQVGTSITVASTATDPAGANDPLTYSWTVTLDGNPFDTQTGGTTYTFIPSAAGLYEFALTVDDGDTGITTESISIPVTQDNVAPEVEITGRSSGVRGQTLEWTFTTTDADAADANGPFDYVIDWGDGSPVESLAGGPSITLSHTFTEISDPSFSIVASATDSGGLTSSPDQLDVTVLRWELQPDPLYPGEQLLVVGGTPGKDRIKVRRIGHSDYIKVIINERSNNMRFRDNAGSMVDRIAVYGRTETIAFRSPQISQCRICSTEAPATIS